MKKTQKPKLIRRVTDSESFPQYLLAFLFPFLTVVSALAINECYPLGDRTMLTVDLYHQYAPFLVAFRNKILGGESLLYSWCDGLGNEYLAAYANYAASPLNIFSLFFNAKTMPVFIGLITAVRAGLASVCMTAFLSANDGKRVDNLTVVFASSYALCGWFVTDFWNIMWCDAVILLPLVMLGVRKLFTEGKTTLYIVALAIALISNYYAGYFICLFLILFAPMYCLMLLHPTKNTEDPLRLTPKKALKCAGKFAVSSVLAGGISAFITIPTYLILQHCSATGDTLEANFNLQDSLFDFLGRLMVAANPNIRDGMANVACGVVIVILLPLFFMLPKTSGIGLRHKICFGLILTIMYLSFTNRMLNFIWHGMHFPNQIPYRESFIMSFLLVFVAHLTVRRLKTINPGAVMGSVAGCIIFLVLYEKFGEGNEGYKQIGLTLLFLIVQGAALRVITTTKTKSAVFCETLLTVTMLIEIFTASTVTISTVASNEGFVTYDFFGRNKTQIETYVNDVEGTEGHNTFERSELYPNNICDIQSIYNVKGISIFSSTARESFVKYMRNFGFHNNGINGFRNAGLTKVTATLLDVRNLIEIKETQTVPKVFDLEYEEGEMKVYGNPDALSVGYVVSDDILRYSPVYENPDVFEKTNEWIKSMGVDGDVYVPVNMTAVPEETENLTLAKDEGYKFTYDVSSGAESVAVKIVIDDATIGSDVYVYTNSNKGGTVVITAGDSFQNFEIRSYQIIALGVYDGSPIELTINYSDDIDDPFYMYAYETDEDVYQQMLDILGDEQLNVTDYDSTTLEGEIDTDGGLLFLTIPYSEGWTAYVDGQATQIESVGDALMGINLSAGHHTIKLKYAPQGIGAGVAIALVSTVATIALAILPNKMKKTKKKEPQTNEE